jgi:hypothetical protein
MSPLRSTELLHASVSQQNQMSPKGATFDTSCRVSLTTGSAGSLEGAAAELLVIIGKPIPFSPFGDANRLPEFGCAVVDVPDARARTRMLRSRVRASSLQANLRESGASISSSGGVLQFAIEWIQTTSTGSRMRNSIYLECGGSCKAPTDQTPAAVRFRGTGRRSTRR